MASFILIYRGLVPAEDTVDLRLIGPFANDDELGAWGRAWQANYGDDPRWQQIELPADLFEPRTGDRVLPGSSIRLSVSAAAIKSWFKPSRSSSDDVPTSIWRLVLLGMAATLEEIAGDPDKLARVASKPSILRQMAQGLEAAEALANGRPH